MARFGIAGQREYRAAFVETEERLVAEISVSRPKARIMSLRIGTTQVVP